MSHEHYRNMGYALCTMGLTAIIGTSVYDIDRHISEKEKIVRPSRPPIAAQIAEQHKMTTPKNKGPKRHYDANREFYAFGGAVLTGGIVAFGVSRRYRRRR